MSIPRDIPFWERRRGGGPVTDAVESRRKLKSKMAAREKRLSAPHIVLGERRVPVTAPAEQKRGDDMSDRFDFIPPRRTVTS